MNLESTPIVSAYRISDGEDIGDCREAAIAAWRGSLGDDDALLGARYDAICLRSPFGRPVLRFVEHVDDGIVGLLALAPRKMRAGGRELRAGVLSHLAIQPAHRSLGPALMLLESVLEAAQDRFDLVYGIPNASQGAGAALRRAGLRPLADMERSVRIVRHGHYLARRLPRPLAMPARLAGLAVDGGDAVSRAWRLRAGPRLRARWVDHVDPAMDVVWSTKPRHPRLTAVRDEAMLRWRFDQGVGIRIRYLLVEDAAGRLQAWFACGVEPPWPHILEVHDFWSAGACAGIALPSLRVLLREARRQGYAAIGLRAAMDADAAAPWRASGFKSRGGQQVVVRWIDPALDANPPPPHLTYIDQDG
ncbi:hypothetical protein [Luteimonas sp. A501]